MRFLRNSQTRVSDTRGRGHFVIELTCPLLFCVEVENVSTERTDCFLTEAEKPWSAVARHRPGSGKGNVPMLTEYEVEKSHEAESHLVFGFQ